LGFDVAHAWVPDLTKGGFLLHSPDFNAGAIALE
jgi:hypothetical protein